MNVLNFLNSSRLTNVKNQFMIRGSLTILFIMITHVSQAEPKIDIKYFKNPTFTFGEYLSGKKFCEDKKGHSPSAREWAQMAMDYGATGIVEYVPGSPPPGPDFELIRLQIKDPLKVGAPYKDQFSVNDQFYYSSKGLKPGYLFYHFDPGDAYLPFARISEGYWNNWGFDFAMGEFVYGVAAENDHLTVCIQNTGN